MKVRSKKLALKVATFSRISIFALFRYQEEDKELEEMIAQSGMIFKKIHFKNIRECFNAADGFCTTLFE